MQRLSYAVTTLFTSLVLAGMKAVCVDAVGAAVMGFNPADLPLLVLGDKKGFRTYEVDAIWTRSNEIEEAHRNFRQPSGWRPPAKS